MKARQGGSASRKRWSVEIGIADRRGADDQSSMSDEKGLQS